MSSVVIAGDTSGTVTLAAPSVAGTTTLTLPTTSGTVTTKDSNGILSVNGVQFPATQSASADANCLDDYEEGSWTPTITATSGTPTYTSRTGKYIKIGSLVTIYANVQYDKNTLSGPLVLASLPLTLPGYPVRGVGFDWYNPGGTAFVNTMTYGLSSTTTIALFALTAANFDGTGRQYQASDLSATGNQLYVTLTYTTN